MFTPPLERPVSQNQLMNVGTLSTMASRRVVVVVTKEAKMSSNGKVELTSQYCAEPSPDVTENVISSLSAKLEGSLNAELKAQIAPIEAQAKADIAKALTTQGSALLKRTQGAQFWRDGLYSLCQAHVNDAIKNDQYDMQLKTLMQETAKLIAMEILLMYAKQEEKPGSKQTESKP